MHHLNGSDMPSHQDDLSAGGKRHLSPGRIMYHPSTGVKIPQVDLWISCEEPAQLSNGRPYDTGGVLRYPEVMPERLRLQEDKRLLNP